MHIITQTARLIIREFLPKEQETYLHHFTDEEVCLYLPKRTTDERINIFQTALANYANSKLTGTWGMFNKESGEFIGSCLLRSFNGDVKVLELGYSMDKKYWSQGIGTEMAEAMVAHSFADADIDEVVAVTVFENISSQRVLEKAGLKRIDNLFRDGLELACFKKTRM
ncbi:MAG: GNAT family N-acetyltransferase [Sphingobacteriales bacterium]